MFDSSGTTASAERRRSGSTASNSTELLDLESVTVLRGGREALSELTLHVGAAERVAIIGPNGSGKSTLLKTITRECYPVPSPAMRCRVMGRTRWNIFELRTLLGIVSPDLESAFEPETTLRDIVLSGFHSSTSIGSMHAISDDMRVRADDALARLGIAHLADRPRAMTSSGEMRRAVIARALVHDPVALVFDEPTTALDIIAQRSVLGALRVLASGRSGLVLVTHQLDDVIPEIDRVILLRDGRVFADGPKRKLLRDEVLSELFAARIRVERHGAWYRVAHS